MKIQLFVISLGLLFFFSCQKNQLPAPVDERPSTYGEIYFKNSKPVELAEQQLRAYNQRDLEAFLAPYSDSVKVYNSLHRFGYQGIENMRKNYQGWFDSLDSLHCEVVQRIATGNTVIDHERLVFRRPGQPASNLEAIAIYKIKHDKIQEVHFVRPEWKNY